MRAPIAMLAFLALLFTGCGGSSAASGVQPTPNHDWTVTISSVYPGDAVIVGDAIVVTLRVENDGSSTAPATTAYWQARDPTTMEWSTLNTVAVEALAAGEYLSCSASVASQSAQTLTFRLIITDQDVLSADNSASIQLTWVDGGAS